MVLFDIFSALEILCSKNRNYAFALYTSLNNKMFIKMICLNLENNKMNKRLLICLIYFSCISKIYADYSQIKIVPIIWLLIFTIGTICVRICSHSYAVACWIAWPISWQTIEPITNLGQRLYAGPDRAGSGYWTQCWNNLKPSL